MLDSPRSHADTTLRKISETREALLDITQDGDVSTSEIPDLKDVLSVFEEISAIQISLKNWIEKEGGKT